MRHLALDNATWSDHANDRPTLMALLGLKDDYHHEGRALAEVLDRNALSHRFGDVNRFVQLAQLYNQINAPVGQFGLAVINASTTGLESGTPQNDSVYTATTQRLTDLGTLRDQLAAQLAARSPRHEAVTTAAQQTPSSKRASTCCSRPGSPPVSNPAAVQRHRYRSLLSG